MCPTRLVLIGSTGGLNNSLTYPMIALNPPLNGILWNDILVILWDYTKLVHTVGITLSLIPVPL